MDFSFITRVVCAAMRMRPHCTEVVAETYKGAIYVHASNGKLSSWNYGMV